MFFLFASKFLKMITLIKVFEGFHLTNTVSCKNCFFCGREELLLVWTLCFLTFITLICTKTNI